MMALKEYLKRPSTLAFLAFTGLYALCMAFIFWDTWALDKAPVGPDNPTFYPIDECARWLKEVLAGGKITPFDLRHVLGGMYFWQELQYAVAGWLAAWGVAYYLRGRRLSRLASYGGGAAFGLMGYAFTLYSAGHLGWFQWMVYGTFAFGLVDRAVRKGKMRTWALLGAVLAWSSAYQPDLWLLFTLLTFAYGLWCLVRERRTLVWSRLLIGVSLCAGVALAVGLPQFRHAIFHDIAAREKQIAETSHTTADAASDDAAARARKAQERWLFCTSWSLPPEDILEFAVSEIHGGSNDPRIYQKPGNKPYRGRLGQHGIVPAGAGGTHPVTGQRLKAGDEFWMPYRQHSLYFGLLTLLLAGAGVVRVFRKGDASAQRGEVGFWAGAAALSLLCALGGFTPFYRLVFNLPMGDLVRAPVKFVHLVELCAAVLAGYGIDAVQRRYGATRAWVVPLLAGLVVVNVLDLARVDAKYLAVQDVAFHRAPNDAAADVVAQGGGKVFVTLTPQEGGTLVRESFGTHCAETAERIDDSDVRFILAGGAALRTDAKLNAQLKDGTWRNIGLYTLSARGGIRRAAQSSAALVLFLRTDKPAPVPVDVPPDRLAQFLMALSVLASCGVVVGGLWPIFKRR